MTMYTGMQTFSFGDSSRDRILVPSTGGSVTVEFWNGEGWVIDSDSPMTSPGTIYTRNVRLRLESATAYTFDDRDALHESN